MFDDTINRSVRGMNCTIQAGDEQYVFEVHYNTISFCCGTIQEGLRGWQYAYPRIRIHKLDHVEFEY